MGVTEFVFEIWAVKAIIWGVFARLSCCQGNFLLHKNDRIFFTDNWCLIWYHNIAVKWLSVVVSILLIRKFLSRVETSLSLRPAKFGNRSRRFRSPFISDTTAFFEILSNKFKFKYDFLRSEVIFVGVEVKRATVTRHNYSRWRRPPNLETKVGDSEIHSFRIQTLSLKYFQTNLYENVISWGSKLFLFGAEITFKKSN